MRKIAVLLFVLVFLFSSCSSEKEEEKTFTAAYAESVSYIDPHKNSSRMMRDIYMHIYETLFSLEGENLEMNIAESISFSDDGKSLEIAIRDSILFSDGTPLEPSDVAFSLNRWAENNANALSLLGDSRFLYDDDTVYVTSSKPLYNIVYMMSSGTSLAVISKEEALSENRYLLLDEITGSGPYVLSSLEPGISCTLEKNENYRNKDDVFFDRIEFLSVSDSNMRRSGLERGEYDFITEVMSEDISSLEKNEDVVLIKGEESESIALVYNKKRGIAREKPFRQMISLLVNKSDVMNAIYGKYGWRADSAYMEKQQTSFVFSGDPYYEKNIEEAVKIRDEHGYENEKVRILVSNLSNLDKAALVIKQSLEEIGLVAEIEVLDWTGFLSRRNDENSFDLFISAFSTVALPQMKQYLNPSYAGWLEDEYLASLIEEMNRAEDMASLSMIWEEAQRYLWESCYVTVCGHYSTINAQRSSIDGVIISEGNRFYGASSDS